jgi:3-dehydroquinate synthase
MSAGSTIHTPIEVEVPLARSPYQVIVGPGLIRDCGARIAEILKPSRCALVTDSNVGPLHAEAVEASLRQAGFESIRITVPAGESSKSFEQTAKICDAMIAAGLDRSSLLVALGGGVVGDLAGFAAAIYYRGIPCIQIPTTIVAQVDSSVGGKTGINAPGGKNLIGSFHQPRLVIADTDTLRTLPPREFHEGFAEIIKHAAIRDPQMLEAPADLDNIAPLIARNVAIKAAIVAEDEFETKGLRALLNFGHTIGHGIENAAGYGRLLHGEAISLGLVAACRLSVEKSGLPQTAADQILAALARHHLPQILPADISTDSILAALRKDKKFHAGAIRFVLLRNLGDAFVSDSVTAVDIEQAIEALR